MRLTIVTTAVACTLAAGGAKAQQDAAPEERRAHEVYVLKGCLRAGAEATEEFVLTEANAIGPAPPAAEIESGETGATQMTYQLRPVTGIFESGVDADELRAHVDSLVEVTVRPPDLEPAPAPAPEGAAAPEEPVPEVFSVTVVEPQGVACE